MSHCGICGAPLSTGGTCYYETQHTGTDINVLVSDEGTIGPAGLHAAIQRLTRERDEARADAARFCGDNERLIKALNAESVEGALEAATRLTRERDRYRAVLEQMTTAGCDHFDSFATTCRSTGRPRDQWCVNCQAIEVLEPHS